jgi:G:T-mismatch repair DNA endonuclease (very short patch repair protein)
LGNASGRGDAGDLLTVPDFVCPDRRIAIYCDGFAYHANADTLSSDAHKFNAFQAEGWVILTFWGRKILREPGLCEAGRSSSATSIDIQT